MFNKYEPINKQLRMIVDDAFKAYDNNISSLKPDDFLFLLKCISSSSSKYIKIIEELTMKINNLNGTEDSYNKLKNYIKSLAHINTEDNFKFYYNFFKDHKDSLKEVNFSESIHTLKTTSKLEDNLRSDLGAIAEQKTNRVGYLHSRKKAIIHEKTEDIIYSLGMPIFIKTSNKYEIDDFIINSDGDKNKYMDDLKNVDPINHSKVLNSQDKKLFRSFTEKDKPVQINTLYTFIPNIILDMNKLYDLIDETCDNMYKNYFKSNSNNYGYYQYILTREAEGVYVKSDGTVLSDGQPYDPDDNYDYKNKFHEFYKKHIMKFEIEEIIFLYMYKYKNDVTNNYKNNLFKNLYGKLNDKFKEHCKKVLDYYVKEHGFYIQRVKGVKTFDLDYIKDLDKIDDHNKSMDGMLFCIRRISDDYFLRNDSLRNSSTLSFNSKFVPGYTSFILEDFGSKIAIKSISRYRKRPAIEYKSDYTLSLVGMDPITPIFDSISNSLGQDDKSLEEGVNPWLKINGFYEKHEIFPSYLSSTSNDFLIYDEKADETNSWDFIYCYENNVNFYTEDNILKYPTEHNYTIKCSKIGDDDICADSFGYLYGGTCDKSENKNAKAMEECLKAEAATGGATVGMACTVGALTKFFDNNIKETTWCIPRKDYGTFCSLSGNNCGKVFDQKKKGYRDTVCKIYADLDCFNCCRFEDKTGEEGYRCGKDEECKHGLKCCGTDKEKGEV